MGERKIWGTDYRQEHGAGKKGLGQPRGELNGGCQQIREDAWRGGRWRRFHREWLFSTRNCVRSVYSGWVGLEQREVEITDKYQLP